MSKIYYYDFLKQNVLNPKFAEEQKGKAENVKAFQKTKAKSTFSCVPISQKKRSITSAKKDCKWTKA